MVLDGRVDKDTYMEATESMQADYSMLMPSIVSALLANRKRYEQLVAPLSVEDSARSYAAD
jgi:deoxyhypusine synthase